MTLVHSKKSISSDAAAAITAAARAEADAISIPMVISICDESGILKAYERMDGAALLSVGIAQDKAYTAVSFGMPSHEWHEFIKNDPPLADGIIKTDRLVVFGGGYPIIVDGEVVGGIGVSGGHYSDDMKVALAGLIALEAS